MKVRMWVSSDLKELAEMNYSLIMDEGHSNTMNIPELENRMKNWLESDYFAAIIEDQSLVSGYALWRIQEKHLYIRQFYIKPEKRRTQLGTKAIELLKKEFWPGYKLRLDVLINNASAHSFWQSVGFNDYCITMESTNA